MHVQVKSWSGARGGSNGCHCCAVGARATVLALCCVSVSAVRAIVSTQNGPTSNSNRSSTTTAPHYQSSRRYPLSCNHPATCWALAACLPPGPGTLEEEEEETSAVMTGQPLLLRERGWLGVPSSDWKGEDGTDGNVWAP